MSRQQITAMDDNAIEQLRDTPEDTELSLDSESRVGPFADRLGSSTQGPSHFSPHLHASSMSPSSSRVGSAAVSGSTSGHSLSSLGPQMRSHSSYSSGSTTPSVGFYQAPAVSHTNNMAVLQHRRPVVRSTLNTDEPPEKPWRDSAQRRKSDRKAYWIFVGSVFIGLACAAVMMWTAYDSVPRNNYCLVLEDQFEGNTLNPDIWFHEIETGGFGNGQFDWTTDSTNNSFVEDGKLYILPTLTADAVGEQAITNGYTLNLTADGTCTAWNKTDANCAVASNSSTGVVLPPIQSARIITNFSRTIKYGRVEVRAKLPTGDWLWPAIWMMPKDSVYGDWPRSGEIDIMESKGNQPKSRDDNVVNAIKGTLHFGPNWMFDGYSQATDVRKLFRNYYDSGFHSFGLEWTEEGIFTWERSPVYKVLVHKFDKDFWDVGKFPPMMGNGTVLQNPWASAENPKIAPFDQEFYLILNVAVGGTNGYFEDDRFPDKPWSNNADNARSDFWNARNRWLPTWPTDPKERAMVVDSVKMWQKC